MAIPWLHLRFIVAFTELAIVAASIGKGFLRHSRISSSNGLVQSAPPIASPAFRAQAHGPSKEEKGRRWMRVLPANMTANFVAQGANHSGKPPKKHSRDDEGRILIFWAVNSKYETIELVMRNLRHARMELHNLDVYLVHYDYRKWAWQKQTGKDWYDRNIQFSAELRGYKTSLMLRFLTGKEGSFNLKRYSWIWSLDEDVDFTRANLNTMIAVADRTKSWIALPAFTEERRQVDEEMSFPFQQPHPVCEFRYVPMVEAIFPLLRPQVVEALDKCEHCIHGHSVWGLCRMWCRWTANKMGTSPQTACAVIDKTPVVHRNFKTLAGKYIGNNEEDSTFLAKATEDSLDVQKHYPDDFVAEVPKSPYDWKCVKLKQEANATAVSGKGEVKFPGDRVGRWFNNMDIVKSQKEDLQKKTAAIRASRPKENPILSKIGKRKFAIS